MSKKEKNSKQNKNIIISSKEIEQFKLMLDNLGRDLSILNTNYKQLKDCNYTLINYFLIN